ncbi:hypothetical protein B0J17DRAFT_633492 [Rhizoctonia solani]|nr:hypothetical protein B0J17DRAFT_633492 [Rhizoctonia solani]
MCIHGQGWSKHSGNTLLLLFYTQHRSAMLDSVPSSSPTAESLPLDQILMILQELEALLDTIPPGSFPPPIEGYSVYNKLITFHPLPSDRLADIGEVGIINRQLEVDFGTRAFGFQIKERGSNVGMVVPILEFYLKKFPVDIILQKWVLDPTQGNQGACITAADENDWG